ncbi:interleukin-17F [Nycticebus coucang]|uniref:interleukin-17F n=1 Tax=Nycticebus coucang TaxID=9470 RepID=UPI00234DF7AF|nr:interleukin-17F [Nycticebus coucang]
MTRRTLRDMPLATVLLLSMLGLAFLKEVVAETNFTEWHSPVLNLRGCPPPDKSNFVKLDIRPVGNPVMIRAQNLQNRSLSPWDYTVDWDPNRYPFVISQAKCRYLGCVDALGREDMSMNSVPIQQETLVLRRKIQGCNVYFQLEKVVVTVGCTCVTPRVRHVGP